MSFAPQMAYGHDKEPDLFGQGFVEPSNDFFDQFVTFESIDNENSVYPVTDESTDLGKPHITNHSSTSASRDNGPRRSHLQEPRSEAWDLDFIHNSSSPLLNSSACNNIYTENSRRASCSDSDLLSLENISLHSPNATYSSPSPPSSPVFKPATVRRHRFVDSISKSLHIPKLRKSSTCGPEILRSPIRKATLGSPTRKVTIGVTNTEAHRLSPQRSPTRNPARKATSPAKMMRASHYSEQNLQEWQARLQAEAAKFDFGFQNPPPLSPPPSARVSDASEGSNHMMAASDSQHSAFTWDQPVPQYGEHPHEVHTPLSTPTTGVHTFSHNNVHAANTNSMMYQPGPLEVQPSGSWPQGSVDQDYNAFVSSSSFNQDQEGAPVWWAHAASAPVAQPSPSGFHRTGSQDTKTLAMQLQNELIYNASELALSPNSVPQGLMIQLPHSHSPHPPPFLVSSPTVPSNASANYFTAPPNSQNGAPCKFPSPQHRYTHTVPSHLSASAPRTFPAPQMRKSRSRGDMSDPPSPTTRSTSQSFSVQKTRRNTSHSQPRAGSRGRQKSEHYSTSSSGRVPKSPKKGSAGGKAGGGGGGFADFVNFTPDDSGKILTGVAPSGSSKTKARREKEAMEKRRRLSQAAMRAVQAAGGSIESLVEEGLLV